MGGRDFMRLRQITVKSSEDRIRRIELYLQACRNEFKVGGLVVVVVENSMLS